MSETDVVIRVEGLGKKYALHHEKAERYTAQRQAAEASEEESWALNWGGQRWALAFTRASLTPHTPHLVCPTAKFLSAPPGGFPLNRAAPQPERALQPPVAYEALLRQAPHGLQPQPQPAAPFSPASARSR